MFKLEIDEWLTVDFNNWNNNNHLNEKFSLLKKAILNKNQITFKYINASNEISKRQVIPLKLIFKATTWYLYGFCQLKKQYRTFKLSRINNLILLDNRFDFKQLPPTTKDVVYQNTRNKIEVSLLFDQTIGNVVYEQFDASQIVIDENGNYLVKMKVIENNWLLSFILSFGSHVQILKPEYLKEKVLAEVIKIIQIYQT